MNQNVRLKHLRCFNEPTEIPIILTNVEKMHHFKKKRVKTDGFRRKSEQNIE